MRSKWKGLFFGSKIFSKKMVTRKVRDFSIIDFCIGKKYEVYNGKKLVLLYIKPAMLGLKFGSFIFTKITGKSIHSRKKKKKN